MADDRTFVLISEFRDGISPSLEKINNSINQLKANLGSFAGKKGSFSDLTQSMGKVIGAHKRLSEEVKTLRSELNASIPVLKEYRKEVGKTVSANMWLQGKGNKQRFNAKNNPTLQFLEAATRQTRELGRASREVRLGGRIPRGGGGGGGGGGGVPLPPRPPRPPRPPSAPRIPGGGGGGGGGYVPPSRPTSTFGTKRFGVSRDETFAFGQTLGYTLGTTITGAVVQGFQIGVGLMVKPFQYFAGAFGERVQDEISDLKAAGGLYSISKRSSNPFLRDIDQAIQYQQDTNKTFAKMAAALPGVTNDYVQVGKRLSDTAARIVGTDFEKARAEANRIRATEEGRKFYGGVITGTGAEQQRQTITTILGELTKKTTIAGLGGRTGAGGIAGAYGLPGLTERMLSQQEVSMGQFQRYAAVFSDPTISDALQRNIDKINATRLNSMDRFQAVQKLLDEVVTPDLIEKLRTSVDGVYQGLRSSILDPDTGLFGLGRNFEDFGRRLNQYGQYVNEAGQVVTDLSEAAKEDLSIFEILRDIFSNAGQVLAPIVEALPLVFDPLKKIANTLTDARHYTAEFARTFNQYREGLEALSKTPGMDFINGTLDIRASLSAINNLLFQLGVIGKGEFSQIASSLTSKDLNIGEILSGLLDKVLNSKVAFRVGEVIGSVVGTVLSETAKVIEFFAGLTSNSSQLASGLKDGFYAAGGPEAFRSIIQNIFKVLFRAILEVFKIAPLEFSIISSVALLLPATVAAFSIGLANALEGFIERGMTKASGQIDKLKPNFAAAEALYDLDKAKVSSGYPKGGKGSGVTNAYAYTAADLGLDFIPEAKAKSTLISGGGGAKSPSGVLGEARRVNPQFPQVAMKPYPAMSLGKGFTAPGIFKDFDEVLDTTYLDDLRNGLKNLLTALTSYLDDALVFLPKLGGKLKGLVSMLIGYLDDVAPLLQNLGGKTLQGFMLLPSYLDDAVAAIASLPKGLGERISSAARGAGAATKGIAVRIVSVGKNVFSNPKGFFGAVGTRLGAGGMAGLRNPLGMLGKFGTAVAGLTGIISGVATFFETGDIWKGLGAAAGPIIGTIIGTALLGPIGGIIGSWVGQQESVINGLGNIFENLAATFSTLIQFIGTLAKDIGWVISKIFNLGDNFDFLGALMKMLEAPFYYLRLGMLGIYELYLNATRRGNSPEAKALRIQREKIFGEDLAKREISSAAKTPSGKSYTPEETIKGLSSSLRAYERYVAEAKATKNEAAIAKNQVVVESLKQEIEKLKKGANPATVAKPGAPAPSPASTPGTTSAAKTPPAAAAPPAPPVVPAEVKQTAANIQQLNTKAATQITQGALTQKATEETKKNTATANTTLGNIRAAAISISNKLSGIQNAILSDLNNIQAGVSSISSLLASGGLKVKSDFGGGGLPGGGSGGPAIFGAAASKFGLTMTSGYRPGDPGYHGINRARDYSNGSGPTPQMMAFAQYMYSAFGRNLRELIYTPLGFSVKDGRKVAPYAQATHNDHVHVAWAFGPNNPVAFNSLSDARQWERSMVPGSAKIASVTANSREGFGTGVNVVNNISITQQPGEDGEALANRVATLFYEAMNNAQSSSIFS
jgi:hypothetical protein